MRSGTRRGFGCHEASNRHAKLHTSNELAAFFGPRDMEMAAAITDLR